MGGRNPTSQVITSVSRVILCLELSYIVIAPVLYKIGTAVMLSRMLTMLARVSFYQVETATL